MRAPAATRCCSLLTRSDLHAVSGLPEFQTKLFPFEAKPGREDVPSSFVSVTTALLDAGASSSTW